MVFMVLCVQDESYVECACADARGRREESGWGLVCEPVRARKAFLERHKTPVVRDNAVFSPASRSSSLLHFICSNYNRIWHVIAKVWQAKIEGERTSGYFSCVRAFSMLYLRGNGRLPLALSRARNSIKYTRPPQRRQPWGPKYMTRGTLTPSARGRRIKGGPFFGKHHFYETTFRGWRPFWASDPALEPQDAAVHLYGPQWHPYH